MTTMAKLLVEVGGEITGFVSSMSKMEAQAARTARAVRKEFENVAGNLATIFSAGMFVGMIKHTIEVQDAVFKMSQKTGIAVESLSALRYAAELSDVSFESLGKAMKKLSTEMVAATDSSSKSAKLFKMMGVDVSSGLEPALGKIADVFKSLPEGPTKAALAVELFGKAGMDLIPLLDKGSAGIEKLREEAKRLGILMDGEAAKAAEEFNDNMKSLKMTSERLGIEIMKGLGGPLVEITRAMLEGKMEGGLYEMAIRGLTEAFAQINGEGPAAQLKKIRTELEMAENAARRLKDMPKWQQEGFFANEGLISQAGKAPGLRSQADALEHQLSQQGIEEQNRRAIAGQMAARAKGMEAGLRGILGGDKAAKEAEDAAKALTAQIDSLEKARIKLNNVQGESLHLQELEVDLMGKWKSAPEDLKNIARAKAQQLDADTKELRILKEQTEETQRQLEAARETAQFQKSITEPWMRATEQMKSSFELLGKSNEEREKAVLLEKARLDIERLGGPLAEGAQSAIADINRELETQLGLVSQIAKEQERMAIWDQLSDAAAKFAQALMSGPKKAIEYLRDSLKQFLYELLAIFTKRWVLQLGAGLTGSSSLGAMAGQVGANTIGGAVADYLSSALGLTGSGAGVGTSLAAGFNIGTGALGGDIAASASSYGIMGSVGEFAGQAWAWAAANPITAVAAVVAIAAIAIGRMRSGGEKNGGSFMGSFGAGGEFLGNAAVPGTDNGRFFTPSGRDLAMSDAGKQFASNFFSTLTKLGGTAGGAFQFGLGTDADPNGSAQSRVSGMVRYMDKTIFSWLDKESGRDDADVQKAFGEMMSRMMLSGLQAVSGSMRKGVAAILNSVVAETASPEQVTAVIQLAEAFGTLMAVFDPINSTDVIEAASKTTMDVFAEQGKALLKLADGTDMTVESLQKMTTATAEFKTAAVQLIVQLEGVKRAIVAMFDATSEQMRLATMDPQQQFDYWQKRADDLYAQIMASSDPGEIERLSREFNTAWSNAWGMLEPDQQAQFGQAWAARLDELSTNIADHIQDVINTVVADTNDVLEKAATKMDEAAEKFSTAAATQSTAANTFSNAVDRGVTVNLILDQYGNPITNGTSP